MSVQVEKLEKSMAKLTITVPAADVDKAMDKVYQKRKNSIQLPGFRKGKAPRKTIEKMYGTGIFYEDAVNELLPDAYADAAEESGLEIVSRPAIAFEKTEIGEDLVFTAEVAVKPEIKLGEYKGIEVKKADLAVTDAEIEAELDKEREKQSTMVPVEDRPVAMGDTATIDFEGFVDGVAFNGGKGTNYPLVIGSNSFIPGFEEALVGAEIGKEVDVNVTFPEDYHAENLKGKAAVFKVTVSKITQKVLPELDDEFAQEVSEFDTLDDYKADIVKKLAASKDDAAMTQKENQVIEAIIANSEIELPAPMIEFQAEQTVDEMAQNMQMQGLSMDQYLQMTGMTMEAMVDQAKPTAEQRIKSRLVLEAVAAAENLEVTDEDVDAELQKMADQYKMELDQLKSILGASIDQMKKDLLVQKAVDFVREAAVEA